MESITPTICPGGPVGRITPDYVNCEWADKALVIARVRVYRGRVKFRWPLVVAYSALFTIFFHYEIRYTHSIWIEFVGGLIIYVACTAAYVVLFEKKTFQRN